jgi:hypothetical protein
LGEIGDEPARLRAFRSRDDGLTVSHIENGVGEIAFGERKREEFIQNRTAVAAFNEKRVKGFDWTEPNGWCSFAKHSWD